ncbi:zinc finger protein GAI-ASSOCIATED FACTOR 1-like isoform X2 [Prosopis cineraria]|uniref:zinc finger protein GAI-ASSOCIATED FACTOR 1-like isoform X2 n=1 Tax=Prosopis cineraria TaxID=364024 RepID=UPI002410397A|nr:zinc finger protein GAI-ASSOCIATED FACTOR 1-like isoform X2 [Prosopis cineraria]
MAELENPSSVAVSTASGEASFSSSGHQNAPDELPPPKKKRNLPGMPDPDAEVIALSPKTLLATNRFVCEICNKGFQRDQNLQLHRRGHNLPWKLRQRTSKDVRKRVYVCPEPSCVHHNPSRALGDLTGIKKHFCRKHGEKKWKCERCSKKYAVQSDWKAHMKTCGTREYKCDCGTLFSRRDSFITHRAFCDALAEESARTRTLTIGEGSEGNSNGKVAMASPPQPPLTPSTSVVSPALSIQSSVSENPIRLSPSASNVTCLPATTVTSSTPSSSTSVFASIFASSSAAPSQTSSTLSSFSSMMANLARSDCPATAPTMPAIEPTSLSLSTSFYLSNADSSLFPDQHDPRRYTAPAQPALSATALLQKAAQMGAASSNASLLRGLGLAAATSSAQNSNSSTQWNSRVKTENHSMTDDGLVLEFPSAGNAGFADLMMGSSSPFGGQPMTRDLLGLSIGGAGAGASSRGGLSALLTSFGGRFGVADSSMGGRNAPAED